ncbi:LmeA family phospholipid-binding protein [Streptomyces sp. NPDC001070]
MRAVRILLILAVILGALFVAADRIAVHFAESEAADRAQQTLGLTSKPGIDIKGFPFLTQVLAKKLDDVEVTADGVQATGTGGQTLRVARFQADLHGVRMADGFTSAVADTAQGSALVTYADLTKAAPSGVTIAYGGTSADGKGRVKVTVNVSTPIGSVKRSVVSEVNVTGKNSIKLTAGDIPGLDSLPPGIEDLIRERIDFTRALAGLPKGIELSSVTANADGITIAATGTQVVLAQ